MKYKHWYEIHIPTMTKIVKTYSTVPMIALKDRKSFIKAIRTAKRIASGKRAASACTACKKSRARCDDTRPCERCRSLGICDGCSLPDSLTSFSIERFRKNVDDSSKEEAALKAEGCSTTSIVDVDQNSLSTVICPLEKNKATILQVNAELLACHSVNAGNIASHVESQNPFLPCFQQLLFETTSLNSSAYPVNYASSPAMLRNLSSLALTLNYQNRLPLPHLLQNRNSQQWMNDIFFAQGLPAAYAFDPNLGLLPSRLL